MSCVIKTSSDELLSAMFKRRKLTVNVSIQQVYNYLALFLLEQKAKYKQEINLWLV